MIVGNDGEKSWVSQNDLIHNGYVFGHNFFTAQIDDKWVVPGMELEFRLNPTLSSDGVETVGVLTDIEVGGITELMITGIDVGMLTKPRNNFKFMKNPDLHREYFETTPASRLVVVEYESMHLEEIMLPDGKFYSQGSISDTDGGWHSGDMRQYIGKI